MKRQLRLFVVVVVLGCFFLTTRGFGVKKSRVVPERLTGFHFLGGLMSFENFIPESTRRVVLLPFWRKVTSHRTDEHPGREPNRSGAEGEPKPAEPSDPEPERRD